MTSDYHKNSIKIEETVDHETESVNSSTHLARVVTVDQILPIEDADAIELAFVLGWQCVVKKGQFKIGDMAVYICIDSVLDPEHDNFKFLDGKRLRSRKIRGALSQGLLGPLSWITSYGEYDLNKVKVNENVTSQLRVLKYIAKTEIDQYKNSNDTYIKFPEFVPKTDEERVQNKGSKFLTELYDKGVEVVITIKDDGTSTSFVLNDDKFVICGRNFTLDHDKNSANYFKIAKLFDIENKMRAFGKNIAIQGEIVGPKINCNRLKLTDFDFRVFNIWDINYKCYMDWDDVINITNNMGLHCVRLVYKGPLTEAMTNRTELLKMADTEEYAPGIPAEGIVIKTNNYVGKRVSFKVISNRYLLEHGI